MSGSLLRSPGYLVCFALVTFYAAILANSGCDAQFLIDNGGGLGVLPPGLRLSQTLQQGGFGLPRPGIFGSRSFDTLTAPAPPDGVAADSAAPDAAAEQPDLAADPPPPPPPKAPPPPPAPSAARGRRNGPLNTTTASAPAPVPGGATLAPAPAPGLPVASNTTAVSFSELIASAALAPAPHGSAPLLAPEPQPATNASAATSQMTDLLAPVPAGAQSPPAAAAPQGPPSGGSRGDPRTEPQSGRSEPGTCEAQGLSGQCNACVCCCIPRGAGGFWRYVPSGSCDCTKIVSKSDVWIALSLLGITVLPALIWAAYFAEALKISPYKPRLQRLPMAAHPTAQNGH
ncbi:g5967 [Coccomyxa elongata]